MTSTFDPMMTTDSPSGSPSGSSSDPADRAAVDRGAVDRGAVDRGAVVPGHEEPAADGAPTPLQQLASFQSPEPRTILVIPFDKSAMHEIEKAIRDSDLGVNPSSDGNQIRCVMPELTEERRREYIKLANHKAEEARVSVRNIRRMAKTDLDKLVKDGEVGEDDGSRAEKELDGLTKKHTDLVDSLVKAKETELLEV